MPPQPVRLRHGSLRGSDFVPRSDQFEGKFGRMFRALPHAQFDKGDLLALAQTMTADADANTPEDQHDDEENTGIRAGYTYLGQFIDHDLTFDPASSLQKQNDPDALTDFRTPRFDLDNLYGRGPDDQPYLYAGDGLHLLLGQPASGNDRDPNTRDLPRNSPNAGDPARALIGDPRNDENVIVSQLQVTMIRFHNKIVDLLTAQNGQPPAFTDAQRVVRWHYQWVVLHDFLPTIIGPDMVNEILPPEAHGNHAKANLKFYKPKQMNFIPIEFTAAAYRFGHSMVRPIYRLNQTIDRIPIFSEDPNNSLVGFRALPKDHAVDWTLFFNIEPRPDLGPQRVQPAYKPDTSVVNPLGHLPPSVASTIPSLPERNLLRGLSMGLPSGQSVAKHMGVPVLTDDQLRVGKATEADTNNNKHLVEISSRFKNNAPLWYYILAEAQQEFKDNNTPLHLGPVGGRIVGEVFVGMLLGDTFSYLHQDPNFQPLADLQRNGVFGMADLIAWTIR